MDSLLCLYCGLRNNSLLIKCSSCGRSLSGEFGTIDRRMGRSSKEKSPDRRQDSTRRARPRIGNVLIPTRFSEQDKPETITQGFITELSTIGMFLKTSHLLSCKKNIVITFHLPNDFTNEITIGGIVKRTHKKANFFYEGMAIIFQDIDETTAEKIASFVSNSTLSDPKNSCEQE